MSYIDFSNSISVHEKHCTCKKTYTSIFNKTKVKFKLKVYKIKKKTRSILLRYNFMNAS